MTSAAMSVSGSSPSASTTVDNPAHRALIAAAVMLSAVMVLLDMTIANVALPHMMGALGVTSEQVTWVLTSYSMAEAIFIPLASYLSLKIGIRKLCLASVTGFIITSALCGQADSLAEMITFRVLQGAFGASVIPLAQSVMVKIFPADQKGKAMAIFSIGILLGPILGPTIGGIITENMDWRWIFYVNLPLGLLCLGLIFFFVHLDDRGKSNVDWPLIIVMAIGIGLLQMVLDKGNEEGWFSSNLILFSTIISAIAWVLFLARSFITKGDIAPMWLLKDRNLAVSCLIMACFSMGLFGIMQLQPMMMEQLLNYPVETTGFLMAPRGIASAIVLICISRYIDKIDPRLLIFIGLILTCSGTWFMTKYSMNINLYWIVMPSLIQGAGMGLVFAPLSQLAYATLTREHTVGGAVVFNLCRTIGSSFGISIVNTYFSRTQQSEWHALGAGITPTNPLVQQAAALNHSSITNVHFMAQIEGLLHQQSTVLAFVYTFGFILISYLMLFPMLLLFKSKSKASNISQ